MQQGQFNSFALDSCPRTTASTQSRRTAEVQVNKRLLDGSGKRRNDKVNCSDNHVKIDWWYYCRAMVEVERFIQVFAVMEEEKNRIKSKTKPYPVIFI